MKLLLINKNPVVSRMMHMSVPKAGFEIEECDSVYNLPAGRYEVVLLDDEMYDENFLQDIKQNIQFQKIGIISLSKEKDFPEFDFVLHKPFLPTDLIELLRKVKSEIQEAQQNQPREESLEEKQEESVLKSEEEGMFNSVEQEKEESIVEIEEREEESPFIEEPLEKAGVLKEEEIAQVSSLLDEESEDESENVQVLKIDEETNPIEETSAQDLLTENLSSESDTKEEQEEQEALPIESDDEIETPSTQDLQTLKNQIERLDVAGLRGILDGMKLEITIKISYPDRDDV